MKKKNIKNKIKGQGEINLPLYEVNQTLIGQLPAYTKEQIKELKDKINTWEMQYFQKNYFMLLNREINYYTIFAFNSKENTTNEFQTLGDAVIDVLLEIGYTIQSEEMIEDHYEIWGKNEEGTYVFMLFPYDQGVVYYG